MDPRLNDVIGADILRSLYLYHEGRFLEGWSEASGATAMAWATGLGKQGGIGWKFAPPVTGKLAQEIRDKVQLEEKSRSIRAKMVVAPPPVNAKDLGDRIDLL